MKMRFYYLLLILTALSNFSFYIPYYLVKYAEHGILFSIVIGLVIVGITQYFQLSVYNIYKNMTAVQIDKRLFGNFWGTVITLLAVSLNLITATFIFSAVIKVANQYLLFESSQWVIALPVISLLMLILSIKPSNYLHCKAFFTVLSFIWVVILFAISTKEIRFSYLQGTLIHSINIPNFASIASVTFFFGGVSHLAFFNPEFKESFSFKKTIIVDLLIGLPILIMSVAIPLGVWGPEVADKVSFVQASTLDTLSVDMFFIERVLYIGIPLLVALMFFNTQNFSYVGYNLLKELNPHNKLYVKGIEAVIYIIFIYATVRLDLDQLGSGFELYLKFWLFTHISIHFMKFIFAKFKGINEI